MRSPAVEKAGEKAVVNCLQAARSVVPLPALGVPAVLVTSLPAWNHPVVPVALPAAVPIVRSKARVPA